LILSDNLARHFNFYEQGAENKIMSNNINGSNQFNFDNFSNKTGNDWTNGFIDRERQLSNDGNGFTNRFNGRGNNANANNDSVENMLNSLLSQILGGDVADDFGEFDEISSDPKLEQGLNELQAKREKGEKGDLFSVVKDSNGTERLIALRKNGESEVVDPAKYNVKTAQEALNVEKGVVEAETKMTALAARQQKGEKGDLFDKVSVNGKEKLLVMRENGQSEINDVEKYGVKTADEAINVEKSIKVTQEKFTKLAEKRDKGEKGDLYDSIEVNGKQKLLALRENGQAEIVDFAKFKEFGVSDTTLPVKQHSGFLGIGGWTENNNPANIQKAIDADKVTQNIQKGVQDLSQRRQNGEEGTLYTSATGGQFKFLVKLDNQNKPDAINYNTYQVDGEKAAITVDKKVDEMRAANPGKAVKFDVNTGETHGKSGFLGIGHWQEANVTSLSLNAEGKIDNVSTNKNDRGGSFFGDLFSWVAPIASVIFPPLAPIIAGISGIKNLAEGNILGAITGIAGGIGGAVGNVVSKVAGGIQGVVNGIQTGDWFGALKSGVGVVGNFAQGAFKGTLDTIGGFAEKAKGAYDGIRNALTGGNFLDVAKAGLSAVGQFSQGAFKNTVDTISGYVDKGKNFIDGVTGIFNGEGSLTDKIRGALTGVQEIGGKAVTGFVNGANNILNKFGGIGDSVSNLFNNFSLGSLGNTVKSFFSGDEDKAKVERYTEAAASLENIGKNEGGLLSNIGSFVKNLFSGKEDQAKVQNVTNQVTGVESLIKTIIGEK
jgi:hypothetical protein